MSEQEKNTTPAQNAAPAAPKPPKIDNAALKKAAAALREENNPQNFNAVINLMMRGVFLAPAKIEMHGICVAKMLDNVGLRYPHRASGAKAPRTLRPLPLLRFAVSATGGAHLCSIQYDLRFCLSICRTSLAVSALRIMRYCLKQNERGIFMYGVSKISSEQNIMLTTFPAAQYSAQSLAEHLEVFAKAGIVVDMICQSAPRGTAVDFSFTTSYSNFAAVMQAIPAAAKANPPLISGGYTKINLFGEDMVTSCGVAARALAALAKVNAEVVLITTSDLDISLLIHQEDEDVALNALNKAFEL